jgi:hypothetical protein
MKFDDSTILKNISIATEFFKAYQAVKAKLVNYPGGTTGFIPFTIDFLVDGISGIKIYDKLLVDSSFLPLNYDDSLEFIVTGIDHSIKDGDWETNIKVTLIPKFDELNQPVTAIDSNIVTYQIPPSSISSTLTNIVFTGDGLMPINKLIWSGESMGGDPSAYNVGVFGSNMVSGISGKNGKRGYPLTNFIDISQLTFNGVQRIQRKYHGKGSPPKIMNPLGVSYNSPTGGVYKDALFATGIWQAIPGTLHGWIEATPGLGDMQYNFENQKNYGEPYFLLKGTLGNYLKGTNAGTFNDLTKAVNIVAGIWASMPTAGNIQVGDNKVGQYSGQGGSHSAAQVASALILSRIQYSKKPPIDFPTYYTGIRN